MKIGFDYWNTISAYPKEMAALMTSLDLQMGFLSDTPWHLHVITAIGKNRVGTVEAEVDKVLKPFINRKFYRVHEVVFSHPRESPQLKLAKCKELELEMFFDDRQDVVDLLNANGILAFKVPRQDKEDIKSERV